MNRQAYSAGFTLLEALVTLVIVSIGLLGLLGLQTVSIVNTQVSAARTQATFAADNIADRMRANKAGVADDAYDGIDHPSADGEPAQMCDDGSSCTAAEMATYDAYIWDQALGSPQSGLPGGQGAIECIENDGSACLRYRVIVRWQEREPNDSGGVGDATTRTFETVVQP